jgi:hypothetical protein
MLRAIGGAVGSAVVGTGGKDRWTVGVMAGAGAAVVEKVASAPSSLSGIAVPTPLLVHGDGTAKSEVTGLACGKSE